jgi:hypothetical protein
MGYLDRVVVLKKPFESIEVSQLAVAMAEKWRLNQQAKLRLDNLEKVVESLLIRGDPATDFIHQPGESIMAADISFCMTTCNALIWSLQECYDICLGCRLECLGRN